MSWRGTGCLCRVAVEATQRLRRFQRIESGSDSGGTLVLADLLVRAAWQLLLPPVVLKINRTCLQQLEGF